MKYINPTLKNACRVLRLLGENPQGLSLAEISTELDIAHTTTIRILSTLESDSFVTKADKAFRLGSALTELSLQQMQGFDLSAIAAPALRDLAVITDETAHLAIPSGYKTLVVDVCDSPHPVRVTSRPGTLAEAHCSATGKVFIAYLFASQLQQMIEACPLNTRTTRTITTLNELEQEIGRVQKQGYAVDDEEFHNGVRCLAAPIRSRSGKVIASIGITGGTQRFTRRRIPEVSRYVRSAADWITERVTV